MRGTALSRGTALVWAGSEAELLARLEPLPARGFELPLERPLQESNGLWFSWLRAPCEIDVRTIASGLLR